MGPSSRPDSSVPRLISMFILISKKSIRLFELIPSSYCYDIYYDESKYIITLTNFIKLWNLFVDPG